MPSMILECSCRGTATSVVGAAYQDATYGVGMRVHTAMTKSESFRCTVCGHERGKPKRTLSKKEEKELKEKEKQEKQAKAAEKMVRRR